MRPLLPLALLAGCTLEDRTPTCNIVDERPVADSDRDLGFSVPEMLDRLDGRLWTLRWVANDDGEPLPRFDLAEVRTTAPRTALPASVRVSEDAAGDCPTAGTFLFAPVTFRVADDAGTFDASAPAHIAASAATDAAIVVETDDTWLTVHALPEDIADAGEAAALEHDPTTVEHEVAVSGGGTGDALELHFQVNGEGEEFGFGLSLAQAGLAPQ